MPPINDHPLPRRIFLQGTAVLAIANMLPAQAQNARFEADITPLLNTLSGGKPIVPGRVKMEIPLLVENGQAVALRVSVPDAATGSVISLHVFAPRNPRPNVANVFFGSASGKPEVVTRVRLGGTQTLVAVAAFSDGSFASANAPVEVTSSACLDMSAA
ncbi:MAG TPA: thiosulfate oxidation carrier protein SoxY [Usitatibacteraceae bacterium]